MTPRRRSEAVLTAVLVAAAVLSFAAAYRGWEGTADWWFWLCMSLGTLCVALSVLSLALLVRTVCLEEHLRVPLVTVTRGPFTKEPPVNGKGRP